MMLFLLPRFSISGRLIFIREFLLPDSSILRLWKLWRFLLQRQSLSSELTCYVQVLCTVMEKECFTITLRKHGFKHPLNSLTSALAKTESPQSTSSTALVSSKESSKENPTISTSSPSTEPENLPKSDSSNQSPKESEPVKPSPLRSTRSSMRNGSSTSTSTSSSKPLPS